MRQIDSTREHLIETYRKKAKHYDITSRFYPVPGYPQRAQRVRAVQALALRPGDSVVEIASGTGLNFSLIEQVIGPEGRIVGVDLTDAMLAQAQHRIETNGWSNISLVQADAAEFDFPTEVDAILSTYALTQVPECGDVIARGAAALSRGGRWVVVDLKAPDNAPRWLAQLGIALVRPFGSIDEWIVRRPWEAIRAAMRDKLADLSWTELVFGTAFLAVGSAARMHYGTHPDLGIRAPRRSGLDRSLDRRHLKIHYAPNPAFENAVGDRAHQALEVDLNPHLGLGLPIVHRFELHPPARRGSAHRPGERQAAGRLDGGHVLGPVATGPEYPLRPLLHPRAGLKRTPSANPTFENRWRPLRPASDVTDIRPHFSDAAGDC